MITVRGVLIVSAATNKKHLKLIKSSLTDEERFNIKLDSMMREIFELNDLSYSALILDEIYNYLADVAANMEGQPYHEDLIVCCYKIKESSFYLAHMCE